ncbi:MAG: glycosyltransferase [Chitinivibrionales bacterium]|nr:glycosyltransferase [Chitinivibrionales bacterium]
MLRALCHCERGALGGRSAERVRILLLIRRLDFGGAENRLIDLANALVRAGHRVIVAAGRGRGARGLLSDVDFRPLPFLAPLRPFTVAAVQRLAEAERIEIVHAHQREPGIVGAVVCSRIGAPLVATLHSRIEWDFDLPWVRQAIARLFVPSEAWVARVARVDPGLADRSIVVPNGLSTARVDGVSRSRLRVLYASRIDRFHERALRLLVRDAWPRVLRRFPRCELAIAGDGVRYGSVRREAIRTNRRVGRETVRTLGYCPDLDQQLARTGLVLGVGRVALEAAGQGAPVLLVNDAHLGPRLRPGNVHLLAGHNFVPVSSPPPTPQRLAAAVCRVLESYERVRVDAEVLSVLVRARFEHRRFVPVVEDGYRAAVEAVVPRHPLSLSPAGALHS